LAVGAIAERAGGAALGAIGLITRYYQLLRA
jgi:hypothetical protein